MGARTTRLQGTHEEEINDQQVSPADVLTVPHQKDQPAGIEDYASQTRGGYGMLCRPTLHAPDRAFGAWYQRRFSICGQSCSGVGFAWLSAAGELTR